MASVEREAIQKQIQQDWANREYVEIITASIKKIADFLNSFGKNLLLFSLILSCVETSVFFSLRVFIYKADDFFT